MIEKLSPKVLEEVRLGLTGVGLSRELIRLPCGNQSRVLATVRQHQLTCRQTARLVTLLGERPESEHKKILDAPHRFLSSPSTSTSTSTMVSGPSHLIKELYAMKQQSHTIRNRYRKDNISLSEDDRTALSIHIREIKADLDHLNITFTPMEATDAIRSKS
jgi:hypothetical protein